MAQKNLEPQLSSGVGAYRREGGGEPLPRASEPVGGSGSEPLRTPPPPIPVPISRSVESTGALLPFFHEISFSGFEPNDTGGSSLFRLWKGQFIAIRSDREQFTVEVTFKQSDTPYVTGPMVQEALETLMEYRGCGCRPSGKVVCGAHDNSPEDAA